MHGSDGVAGDALGRGLRAGLRQPPGALRLGLRAYLRLQTTMIQVYYKHNYSL